MLTVDDVFGKTHTVDKQGVTDTEQYGELPIRGGAVSITSENSDGIAQIEGIGL